MTNRSPAKDRDIATFLGRVRNGWMLLESIRTLLFQRGLITKGLRRDWLTAKGASTS